MALAEEKSAAKTKQTFHLIWVLRSGLETRSCLIYANAFIQTLLYLLSAQGQSFKSKEGTQVTLVESEWLPGAPMVVSAHFTLVEILQLHEHSHTGGSIVFSGILIEFYLNSRKWHPFFVS